MNVPHGGRINKTTSPVETRANLEFHSTSNRPGAFDVLQFQVTLSFLSFGENKHSVDGEKGRENLGALFALWPPEERRPDFDNPSHGTQILRLPTKGQNPRIQPRRCVTVHRLSPTFPQPFSLLAYPVPVGEGTTV